MIQLSPYLNFMGKGTEAMKFYHSILGGKLDIQSYGDSGQAKNDSEKDYLMHGALQADGISLYASDGNEEHKVIPGTSVHLSLMGDDEAKLT